MRREIVIAGGHVSAVCLQNEKSKNINSVLMLDAI